MKPNKFRKICKKYFAVDPNFTIEYLLLMKTIM